MGVDLWFLAVGLPAALFAGVSKGGFGSGAAFAATPLLAMIIDPVEAIAVMLPVLIVIDAATLGPYWRQWSGSHARLLILGGLPGLVAGALLLPRISADGVRLAIGLVALGFVAFQLARARGHFARIARQPVALGYGWGALAGFTSFVSHAGGPPAAIFLLGEGLDKRRFQATTVVVFAVINLVKLGVYAAIGFFSAPTLMGSASLAPAGVLGAALGVAAHRLVPERWFFAITYALLTVTGGKLVFDALT